MCLTGLGCLTGFAGLGFASMACLAGLTGMAALLDVAGIANLDAFYGLMGMQVVASPSGLAGRQLSTYVEHFTPGRVKKSV